MAAKAFIALGMAAISAMGAIKQGNAADAAAKFEADQLRQQGQRDRQIAVQQSQDFRNEQARTQATLRARVGGSGTTLEGTPLAVLSDLASETELQALRIEAGGATAQSRAESQAALRRFEGKNAKQAGRFKAGTTLLTAAAGASGGFGGGGTAIGATSGNTFGGFQGF